MNSNSVNTAPTNEYNLSHLLTEVRRDGLAVEHFVCQDCMELAEKSAETEGATHECLGASLLSAPPSPQGENASSR